MYFFKKKYLVLYSIYFFILTFIVVVAAVAAVALVDILLSHQRWHHHYYPCLHLLFLGVVAFRHVFLLVLVGFLLSQLRFLVVAARFPRPFSFVSLGVPARYQ